jgi:Ca2+-transporting ATPase
MNKEYLKSIEDTLETLKTNQNGLTDDDAESRKEKYGLNKIKEPDKESLVKKLIKELSNYMTIVLIIAAIVSGMTSLYSGESMIDSFIILFVVLMNAILGVYQETKAEEAIASLQEMSSSTSKVNRNGKQIILKSEDLVPGDIIFLEAGDSIPADARLIESASLKVEEAALTGESEAVLKACEKLESEVNEIPLGDRKNMVYMGSTAVYGRGVAVICATGMQTEIGHIAEAITKAKNEETPLQVKLNQLSKTLSILVLAICAAIFIFDIVRLYTTGEAITGSSIINTFMIAVSLAVAAIPEGLSAVVTVLLSIGVTKMSKNKAIIRKLTAVETLGCTQIICSDKTGTLTQNKMTVVEHITDDDDMLMKAMSLCSDAEVDDNSGEVIGEPTECALVADAFKNGINKNELKQIYTRKEEAPFDSMRKMMSTIHINPTEGNYIQFTKGAPDEVLRCCTKAMKNGKVVNMTDTIRDEIISKNKEMADKALRVLCAATTTYDRLPENISPEKIEHDLIYIGLSCMKDPIRPEVKTAIEECRQAGIRPIMITGDHKDTAVAIAKELGILSDGQHAISGSQLNEMSDEAFENTIEQYSVYARVQPEHKVRIVNGWKKKGMVTAMTGDGVNDAPSIKNADIGIGMGITGTDVTKNVADMVLADDNFATIISAVAEGRRIYDNIRKAIQFLLSSNLAEVFAIFISSILGFTILKPVHLLWINLITDCFPAIGLGMEEAENDIMKRKPRNPKDSIFAEGVGFEVVFQGFIIAALTLMAYFIGHYMESGLWEIADSADGMTMAFLTLSLLEIFHSFNMRSRNDSIFRIKTKNPVLFGSLITSFVLTTAVIYIPFLREAFSFEFISLKEYIVAIIIAFMIIPIVELSKMVKNYKNKN